MAPLIGSAHFNDGAGDSDISVTDVLFELDQLRQAEDAINFRRAKLGRTVDLLNKRGELPQLQSVLLESGRVSKARSRHQVVQSEAFAFLPGLKSEVEPIGADYLEIISRQLSRLSQQNLGLVDSAWVVETLRRFDPENFRRRLSHMVEQLEADLRLKETGDRSKPSQLSHWQDNMTGTIKISAELSPLDGEVVGKAIDAEARRLASQLDKRYADKYVQAQALKSLVVAGAAKNRTGAIGNKSDQAKPLIEVQVDLKTFLEGKLHRKSICETTLGTQLATETLQRLSCDSLIQRVVFDNKGVPVNVGRSSRTATKAQRSAARAIYSSCAWFGCGERFDWCEMHHIKFWRNGGESNLDNLVPLCSKHHHLVHEGGWLIELLPDRRMRHLKPDGTLWKTGPPPSLAPPDLELDIASDDGTSHRSPWWAKFAAD